MHSSIHCIYFFDTEVYGSILTCSYDYLSDQSSSIRASKRYGVSTDQYYCATLGLKFLKENV